MLWKPAFILTLVDEDRCHLNGLSMPHSPPIYHGELWVLNGGMGRFEPRVFCPGFLRGLSLHGGFAFVGLPKPSYKRCEGLELDQRLKDADSEPWCGVQIIDLLRGLVPDRWRHRRIV